MKITTTAFIFYKDKLLIVYHKKIKRWMHVGGHVEEDEWLDEAILREIKEETGLKVKILGDQVEFPSNVTVDKEILRMPFLIHGRMKEEKRTGLAFDYVCVAESDEVHLQIAELDDFKWITEEEIDALDSTPFFKAFAKKAFEFYSKNS